MYPIPSFVASRTPPIGSTIPSWCLPSPCPCTQPHFDINFVPGLCVSRPVTAAVWGGPRPWSPAATLSLPSTFCLLRASVTEPCDSGTMVDPGRRPGRSTDPSRFLDAPRSFRSIRRGEQTPDAWTPCSSTPLRGDPFQAPCKPRRVLHTRVPCDPGCRIAGNFPVSCSRPQNDRILGT